MCCDHIFCFVLNGLIQRLKSTKITNIFIPVVLFQGYKNGKKGYVWE